MAYMIPTLVALDHFLPKEQVGVILLLKTQNHH